MTITLDATVAGANSNSYVASTTEADDIVDLLEPMKYLKIDRTGWDAASTDGKTVALVFAADRIDQLRTLDDQYSDEQKRAYPLSEGTIPDQVKWAQVAEACLLLADPGQYEQFIATGIASFSTGDESVTFSSLAQSSASRAVGRAAETILAAAGLIGSPGGAGSVHVPR